MTGTQLNLDDYAPGRAPARARRTDNDASHAAADRISGTVAGRQKLELLRAVRSHPGRTIAELDALGLVVKHDAGRRAPELAEWHEGDETNGSGHLRRERTRDGWRLELTAKGWALLEDIDTRERT